MRFARRPHHRPAEAIIEDGPLPVQHLEDPEDIEVLRVAIELASARGAASSPTKTFVTTLGRRLGIDSGEQEASSPGAQPLVSRRALITATATATVAAGVGGGITERLLASSTGVAPAHRLTDDVLLPNDGVWTPVTLDSHPTTRAGGRFVTAEVTGFVSEHGNELVAVSGVCTHLGCLLRANEELGRLDCPCHRTAFSYDGEVLFSQLANPPAPLPRLRVRRRNGAVEVLLPPPI